MGTVGAVERRKEFVDRTGAGAEVGTLLRGAQVLKVLAAAGHFGLALSELSARTGFPRPSVHRVLQQLLDERLVARHAVLRRYRLGPLAFELGQASTALYGDLRDLCDSTLQDLAAQTGDTTYLVLRSGFEAVCIHRHEGFFL